MTKLQRRRGGDGISG